VTGAIPVGAARRNKGDPTPYGCRPEGTCRLRLRQLNLKRVEVETSRAEIREGPQGAAVSSGGEQSKNDIKFVLHLWVWA